MRYANIFRTLNIVNFIKLSSLCITLLLFINTAAMALSIPPMTLPPLNGTPNTISYSNTGGGTVTRTKYDKNGIREESTTLDSNNRVIAETDYDAKGNPISREHFDPKTGKSLHVYDDFHKDGSFTRTRYDAKRKYIIGRFDKNGNPINKKKTTKKSYGSNSINSETTNLEVNKYISSYRIETGTSDNSTIFNREYGLSNINTDYTGSGYSDINF
ncbi:MAG: hypothetical protein GWO07_13425 [Candidatus Dadabacteria bacterium]|nr:hypothetical protein [Candidatus Dadabacteria bacterium]NIV42981.1 hypothetical protein [Candidatus Dadabacteria bacterium]NIX16188.1 hypothetical protein [Candidatus Dadabacteria bacterium]